MEGFCRGCLIRYYESSELLSYTEKIRRLFVYCTGIQVKPSEAATFQLCKDCFMNMKLSCKFKKQCRTSDKKYRHYLVLKEAGDAFEFTTYIKNNDDSLRFPSLSGQSTPAHHRLRDDDNDSTCTSIRNFMTDIFQGEEVPDSEARIIKEVIEEQTDMLDDSLDSQWLRDDISIDADLRLDFSLSPFSTPRSTQNNDNYTPIKHLDANIHNENNHPHKQDKINDSDVSKGTSGGGLVENISINQSKSLQQDNNQGTAKLNHEFMNETIESEDVFEDIVENVTYLSRNESDIAVRNLMKSKTISDNDQSENIRAVTVLQDVCPRSESLDTNLVENENSMNKFNEQQLDPKDEVDAANKDVNNIQTTCQSHDEMNPIANYVGNNVNNIQASICLSLENGNEFTIRIDKPVTQNERVTEQNNCTVDIFKQDISTNDEMLLNDGLDEWTKAKLKSPTDSDKQCNDEKDIIKDINSCVDNKSLSLDDLLISHTGYNLGPGASTPTINNILFGDKLESDEETDKFDRTADKISIQSGETDILDKILRKGVKEFNIATPPTIESMYDLEKLLCKICDKTLKTERALKVHLVKIHKVKIPYKRNRDYDNTPRVCAVCGKCFKHFASYNVHMKKHMEPLHQCTKCKLTFITDRKLKYHMKSHNPLQDVTKDLPDKQYVCTVCGRKYSSSGSFAVHKKRHSQKYSFTCKECGKGFYRSGDLENHVRIHTGEKPFACKYCDKSFRIKHGLVKHVKVHLDEKMFQCDHCSSKYILKSDLVYHLKYNKTCLRIRGWLGPKPQRVEKVYTCHYCGETFNKQRQITQHQKNFRPCANRHNDPEYIKSRKVVLPVLYVDNKNDGEQLVTNTQDLGQFEDVTLFEV